MLRDSESFVLFLAGEHLAAEKLAVPGGATAVWCDRPDQIVERAERLRPRCIFLDRGAAGDAVALARAARRAAQSDIIVALVGRGGDAPAEVDVAVDAGSDLRGEVARLVRFALGQSIRAGSRVRAPGKAVVQRKGGGRSVEVEVIDISEDGIRIDAADLEDEDEVSMKVALSDGRELCFDARSLRRQDESIAYRFADATPRARAALRSFLVRHGAVDPSPVPLPARTLTPRHRGSSAAQLMIGDSPAMRRSVEVLDKVAPTPVTVLLLGETGTGKEMAARILHERSARAGGPFVVVNCAALAEHVVEAELFGNDKKIGRIEQAQGGTLFLDEIAELPATAQARLLHALADVDVRLIAATNQDLEAGMQAGSFRRDLFFRLNVVSVNLPPLRERPDDIPALVEHFLSRAQEQMGKTGIHLNEHAEGDMLRYPWPGNVRELENLCTRLVALAPSYAALGPEHLNLLPTDRPATSPLPSTDLRDILDFCEREIVRRMLDRHGGNRTRTAKALGISRQALQQKLARFRAQGTRHHANPASPLGDEDEDVGSCAAS